MTSPTNDPKKVTEHPSLTENTPVEDAGIYHSALKVLIESDQVVTELTQPELIDAKLTDLLERREIAPTTHIDPTKIFPGYADYKGTYNVSHELIGELVPGYKEPSEELFAERKKLQDDVYGTMPAHESSTSIEIVRALKPRTILEIGTHQGHLLKGLLDACPADTFAISLDLPATDWDSAKYPHDVNQSSYVKNCTPEQMGSVIHQDEQLEGRVGFIKADSGNFDFSPFKGKIDVVVVDGNHTYEAAANDLELAMELVSENGIILIDDVNKPFRLEGVTLAVLEQTYHKGKTFYFANHMKGPDGNLAFYLNTKNVAL